MTAVAEIIVKGCSRVLGLLTTGISVSYVTTGTVHYISRKRAQLCRPDVNTWWAGFWPAGHVLDTPELD